MAGDDDSAEDDGSTKDFASTTMPMADVTADFVNLATTSDGAITVHKFESQSDNTDINIEEVEIDATAGATYTILDIYASASNTLIVYSKDEAGTELTYFEAAVYDATQAEGSRLKLV